MILIVAMLRLILACTCLLLSVQGASLPRPLEDVSVPVAYGKKIRLTQYRGKVMVVALISTTCDPCINSVKLLGQLQAEYGPRGFQAFAIAGDDQAEQRVDAMARLGLGFPIGYLDQNTNMKVFDFKRGDSPFVPIFMFVDKKGTVRFQYTEKDDLFKAEEKNTRYLIEALLKQ